jgi:chromosome segregation ATPase
VQEAREQAAHSESQLQHSADEKARLLALLRDSNANRGQMADALESVSRDILEALRERESAAVAAVEAQRHEASGLRAALEEARVKLAGALQERDALLVRCQALEGELAGVRELSSGVGKCFFAAPLHKRLHTFLVAE